MQGIEKNPIDSEMDWAGDQRLADLEQGLEAALVPEAAQEMGIRGWAKDNLGKLVVGGTVSVAALVVTGASLSKLRHSH